MCKAFFTNSLIKNIYKQINKYNCIIFNLILIYSSVTISLDDKVMYIFKIII